MPQTSACSTCGKAVYRGKTSRAEIICHECRRKQPAPYKPGERNRSDKRRIPATCEHCGAEFGSRRTGNSPTGWTRYCSRACFHKSRVVPDRGPANRWANMSEEARQRKRAAARQRHRAHQLTYDGVSDEQIMERDRWTCRMDVCIYGSRRISRKRKYPDPRSASVDHIVPLSLSRDDTAFNKRAAHLGCNMARGAGRPGEQMPLDFAIALPPRQPKPLPSCSVCSEPLVKGKCSRHSPVYYLTCQSCGQLSATRSKQRITCGRTECKLLAQASANWKRDSHKRGLQAAQMSTSGMSWDEIADRLGYSGAPYAAAAAARATGVRSQRKTGPYVRVPRLEPMQDGPMQDGCLL